MYTIVGGDYMSNRILESVKGSLKIENLTMSKKAENCNNLILSNKMTVNEAVKTIKEEYCAYGKLQ